MLAGALDKRIVMDIQPSAPRGQDTTENDQQTALEQDRAQTPRDLGAAEARRETAQTTWPPAGWAIHPNAPVLNLSQHAKGPETITETLKALAATNDPPQMLQRSGQLVTVIRDERGVASLRIMDTADVSVSLMYLARWRRTTVMGEGEERRTSTRAELPPTYIARAITRRSGWPQNIIVPLRGLSPTPLLRESGSLHAREGYDRQTLSWYAPNPNSGESFGERMAALATQTPTQADAVAALATLCDWLADFPFDGPPEQANALALFLTLLARPLLRESGDNIPLALIEASKPRTGKTLLAETLVLASLGVMPALTSMPPNEEEMGKSLLTIAMSARPYWILDNLSEKLDSASLASALTTGRIQRRELGGHRDADAEIAAVMIATANQPIATSELLARSYRIRLNANMARPQDRDPASFQHRYILRYTREHRADLIAAGLTILRAYLLAGSPAYTLVAKGGYEGWVELVGGALSFAGVAGFLGNERALAESADDEAGEVERFLAALCAQYGSRAWRAGDLLKDANAPGSDLGMALPGALADVLAYPSKFTAAAGRYLGRLQDVPYGAPEMRLRSRRDSHTKNLIWCVEGGMPDETPVQEPPTNGHTPIAISEARRLVERGQGAQ
jgi:hypothetical protein